MILEISQVSHSCTGQEEDPRLPVGGAHIIVHNLCDVSQVAFNDHERRNGATDYQPLQKGAKDSGIDRAYMEHEPKSPPRC